MMVTIIGIVLALALKDKKSAAGKRDLHPEMMGDETEEQNLNQPGNPKARIKKDEVEEARQGWKHPEIKSAA